MRRRDPGGLDAGHGAERGSEGREGSESGRGPKGVRKNLVCPLGVEVALNVSFSGGPKRCPDSNDAWKHRLDRSYCHGTYRLIACEDILQKDCRRLQSCATSLVTGAGSTSNATEVTKDWAQRVQALAASARASAAAAPAAAYDYSFPVTVPGKGSVRRRQGNSGSVLASENPFAPARPPPGCRWVHLWSSSEASKDLKTLLIASTSVSDTSGPSGDLVLHFGRADETSHFCTSPHSAGLGTRAQVKIQWRRGETADAVARRFIAEHNLPPAQHLQDTTQFVQATMDREAAQAKPDFSYPVEAREAAGAVETLTESLGRPWISSFPMLFGNRSGAGE